MRSSGSVLSASAGGGRWSVIVKPEGKVPSTGTRVPTTVPGSLFQLIHARITSAGGGAAGKSLVIVPWSAPIASPW